MTPHDLTHSQRLIRLVICAAVGIMVWFLGIPEEVSPEGWLVLSVFISVIVGFLLQPMPMGPLVAIGLIVLSGTGTIEIEQAMSGFGNHIVWLVVAAFLLAGSVVHTGFGKRVALWLVVKMGRTTLGLGYALCAADLFLAPVIPSNTARGGGVLAPIMRSLASALDSEPHADPNRAGAFLAMVGSQATVTTSAMFLTAMAANGLVVAAAESIFGIEFGFITWALGAIVPGLLALAAIPLIIYRLFPPGITQAGPAREEARRRLNELGPWTRGEFWLAGTLTMLIALWSMKPLFAKWSLTVPLSNLDTTTIAWIGLIILLLSGTATWNQMIRNYQAWDTLVWLGGLLVMARLLLDFGVVGWLSGVVQDQVTGFPPIGCLLLLAIVYFYSMYLFSMLTAHITAMVAAFLGVDAAVGAPALISVALLAYFSNVCACLTNYSTGPVIVYFGHGYVPTKRWFYMGAVVSLAHMVIWLGAGLLWWKAIGWW